MEVKEFVKDDVFYCKYHQCENGGYWELLESALLKKIRCASSDIFEAVICLVGIHRFTIEHPEKLGLLCKWCRRFKERKI